MASNIKAIYLGLNTLTNTLWKPFYFAVTLVWEEVVNVLQRDHSIHHPAFPTDYPMIVWYQNQEIDIGKMYVYNSLYLSYV